MHVPLSPRSIIRYRSQGSDVLYAATKLTVGHAAQTSVVYQPTLQAQRLSKGDEHPAYRSSWRMALSTIYLYHTAIQVRRSHTHTHTRASVHL